MADAFRRVVQASDALAVYAVVVDAKDERQPDSPNGWASSGSRTRNDGCSFPIRRWSDWSRTDYIPGSMKAVIVAAGYGSRFLPASKTVPKEMFPVIDRPAIDFILQELRDSGVDDILFITSRRKRALEDYVDREVELEQVFESEGAAAKQRTIAVPPGRFLFLRQQRMLGTGQAIL